MNGPKTWKHPQLPWRQGNAYCEEVLCERDLHFVEFFLCSFIRWNFVAYSLSFLIVQKKMLTKH